MTEFVLNPDSEMLEQCLVLSLLVKGRTTIEDFSWTKNAKNLVQVLQDYGLSYTEKGSQLILEGMGFQYKIPPFLAYNLSEQALIFLWTLASKDFETLFSFSGPEEDLEFIKAATLLLKKYFVIQVHTEESLLFRFTFLESKPTLKKNTLGEVPFLLKNRLILGAILQKESLEFQEKISTKDSWTRMLIYFGANIVFENRGMELDELARRMAKARGIKLERTWHTQIQETLLLTTRDYFVPGDVTECTAIVVATLFSKAQKKSVKIKNVCINPGRVGVFNALRRMGASIEILSRRERYGDLFGDIEVKPLQGKRLQARRFSEEQMASSGSEWPFLALAACFAEGESILRIPSENKEVFKQELEDFAINFRKTGAEIGVYDYGIVLRGKEELDGGDFEAFSKPVLGLTLFVFSFLGRGHSSINNIESLETEFSGLTQKLKQLLKGEPDEVS